MFRSYAFSFGLFSLIAAFLALFHILPIYVNEFPQYGLMGFIASLFFIPFLGFILCCLNWLLLNFGCFLSKQFRKLTGKDKRQDIDVTL